MFEGCPDKKYKTLLSCKTCLTGLNTTFFYLSYGLPKRHLPLELNLGKKYVHGVS